MRILHVADRLTDRGGSYHHLLGILEHLAREHEVLLAVGRDDGSARAPCPVTVVPGLEARADAPVALDVLARELRPDVVHVHNVVNPAALEWAAADGRGVLTVQDHRSFCPGRGKWTSAGHVCDRVMGPDTCAPCFDDAAYFRAVRALTERRLAAAGRLRVTVLSRYMKRELVAAGVAADRIAVIPPFVHGLDSSAAPDGPPCVLFVGRLVEAKGVGDALEAWRLSRLALPLAVAGAGPLRDGLDRAGVEVLGWVSHARMSAVYRRARAVLMPSRWQEPFGIAGLEALAMGVPVVAWESGGVAEWHPGPLVRWGDVDGLARALGDAVGERAEPAAGFEPEPLVERLVGFYAETVRRVVDA
jgi:glycosyltransferase involved in cell wall biosynthesis